MALLSCSAEEPSELSAGSSIHPEAASRVGKAQQLLENRRFRAALAHTDTAATIDGDVADIYFVRGRIFTQLNLYERAESSYKQALSIDPDYEGAWFNLGNNYFRRGRFRQALTGYIKEEESYARPRLFLHMAQAYGNLGKVDSAMYAYRRALAIDSSYAPAYAWLGQLHKEQGETNEAIAYTERALALDSTNLKYQYFLGNLSLEADRPEAAVAHLQPVVLDQPWHYAAHYNLGRAYARLGKQQQARKHLAKADTLQEKADEIEQLRGMAQERPRQLRRWIELGNALQEIGRFRQAEDVYSLALSLEPDNVAVRNDLANLAMLRGDTTEAIRRYETILETNPGSADVWLNLGVVYANSGAYDRAADAWKKAVQYDPDHTQAKSYLEKLSAMRSK